MGERGDDLDKFAQLIRDESKPEGEIMKLRLRKDQLLKIYRMTRPVESTARARIGKLLLELRVPKSDIPYIKIGVPLEERATYDLLADLKTDSNPTIMRKIANILVERGVRDPALEKMEVNVVEFKKMTIRELKDICRSSGALQRLQRKSARQELIDRGIRLTEIPFPSNERSGRFDDRRADRGDRFDRNGGGRFREPSPPRPPNAFIQGLAFAQIVPNGNNMNPNMFPNQGMGPIGMGNNTLMTPGHLMGPTMMAQGPSIRDIQQREIEMRSRGRDEPPRRDRSPFRDHGRHGNGNERRGGSRFDEPPRRERGVEESRGRDRPFDYPSDGRFNAMGGSRPEMPSSHGRDRSRSPVRLQERSQKDKRKVRVLKQSGMPFSERDVAMFGELLFDIIKGTVGRAPLIEDTVRRGPGLVITCADDYSQQWLLQFVPRLLLNNESLRAVIDDDNPTFELLFPCSNKPVKELFLMLEKFNDWVDTSRWYVIDSRDHENGLLLTVKAPPDYLLYFKKYDWKLFFGLQPVRVFSHAAM